jgi:ribonuclease-3
MAECDDLQERLGGPFRDPGLLHHALTHSSFVNENPGCATTSNERLEYLGDAVLGLVVAEELYTKYPDLDEGPMTELRTHVVRRDTLAEAAERLGLGACLYLGKGEEAGGGRTRPTNLAHAYEAVVGAIYLDRGLEAARDFVLSSLADVLEEAFLEKAQTDAKSRLQEVSQSTWQTTPDYRLVKSEGPDHARRFTVEVRVCGEVLGSGVGTSKQAAEKAAARAALDRLASSPEREGSRDA